MYKNLVGRAVQALASTSFFFSSLLLLSTVAHAADPLKIGFVYVTPVTDAGWTHQHDEGRKAVEAALGKDKVKTTFVENVAEGPDAERVIRDLAMQGNK